MEAAWLLEAVHRRSRRKRRNASWAPIHSSRRLELQEILSTWSFLQGGRCGGVVFPTLAAAFGHADSAQTPPGTQQHGVDLVDTSHIS